MALPKILRSLGRKNGKDEHSGGENLGEVGARYRPRGGRIDVTLEQHKGR